MTARIDNTHRSVNCELYYHDKFNRILKPRIALWINPISVQLTTPSSSVLSLATSTMLMLILLTAFLNHSSSLQPKSNDHNFRCGQRPISALPVITAGQSAWPGQFPWHAALYRTQQLTSTYICGGFLASDRMILTAAHCVTAENGFEVGASGITVRLGVHELLTMVRNTQEHRVERIYRHEHYTARSYRHDVAVLLLETVVEFNEYVQPICLWRLEDYGEGAELSGLVSGWGLTEYDVLANTLKAARMPMVGYLECLERDRELFSQVVFEGMFCAGWKNGKGGFIAELKGLSTLK